MRKNITVVLLIILSLGVSAGSFAQDGRDDRHFERGEALYRSGRYSEAFEEYRKGREICRGLTKIEERQFDYFMAMSAAKGGKSEALYLIDRFLTEYPESAYASELNMEAGNICFDRERYAEALRYYEAVNVGKLGKERDEYNFKIGYSYFVTGDYDAMFMYMEQVGFRSEYYVHAQYCMGYADYRLGRYDSAKQHFMVISDSEAYKDVLPFYLLYIEFGLGNYHYVTENGERVLRMTSARRSPEMIRIIGEAWFHTEGWKETVEHLTLYRNLGGLMERDENYMVGYSYYMLEDFKEAEKYLSKVPGRDDELSQNASYHLGDVYLKSGDKQRAMQSFSIASAEGYDENIREDAMFNYGKLQYELGGGYFNEAINVLNKYLTLYPRSPRAGKAKEYLVAAYYNSRNFEAAYQAIMQLPDPDNNTKAALQKITYFRALECINSGNYDEAAQLLELSLNNKYNAKYTALAGYWQGELLYREGHYDEAIKKYETYMRLSPKGEEENIMARYNTGYACFNRQDWDTAMDWFDDFLYEYKKKDRYAADTYNRMGDIEYARSSYWRAIEYYDEAAKIGAPERYYSELQRAMMLGMVDRTERKTESLNDIIKKGESPYVADAMYELGNTYVSMRRYRDGAATLENFIKTYPNSPKYVPALLDLGLVYRNLNDNDKALSYYKMVVEREKTTDAARDAMNGIRSIYVDRNDVSGYFDYAHSMGIETDTGRARRDSLEFAAALRVYMTSNDTRRSAEALNNYIKQYPNGAYQGDALYYSGENALVAGNKSEAFGYFEQLSKMPNNNYTVKGLERQAQIGMELKRYGSSAAAYEKLSRMVGTAEKKDEALKGYMRATVLTGNDENIIRVANNVISSSTDGNVTREAKYAKAKSLMTLGGYDEALVIFADLSKDVGNPEGAEAAYMVIDDTRRRGDNAAAEKLIYDFADKNTPYIYWLGRSFLILGDIYAEAGDTFQARATYQSIIDGYTGTKDDGILEEANKRIKELGGR